MRILVGSLDKKGRPEKGTRLNWVLRPMGQRIMALMHGNHGHHFYWIGAMENYYDAVERVRIEEEQCRVLHPTRN